MHLSGTYSKVDFENAKISYAIFLDQSLPAV